MKEKDIRICTSEKTNSGMVHQEVHLAQVETSFLMESPKITSLYVERTKIAKDSSIEIYVHARDIHKGGMHWIYSFTGSNGFFYESQEPEAKTWIKVMLETQQVGLETGDELTFSVSLCNRKEVCDTHELIFTIVDSSKEGSLK